MGTKTALPAAELGLYSLVLSGALAYAGRGLLEASQDGAQRKAFRESVRPGWEYIGRKMDVADFEWVMWFGSFRNVILFTLSGHVLFAKLCTMVAPQLRAWMYAVYGALAVVGTMGPWYLLLLLGHCVGHYVASLLGQPWLCLGLGMASLASFKLDPLISWQNGFVTGTFDLQEVLFQGGSGFTALRCTSFALESCAHPDRRYSLADLLKYNFYLPFFFFGPIMTFDRFHAQVSQVEPVRREGELWHIRAQAGLSVAAIIAVDIFFHFFYILTIPSDLKFASRLPDSALAALAYSNLVYDWVKAAVLFGVVNTVARLDHLDPPQPPKCITALYIFAETHFDRGINDWLCNWVHEEKPPEVRNAACAVPAGYPLPVSYLPFPTGLSVGADVSQGPGHLWGHELLGYHHVQPCKPEQPGVHRAGRPAPATLRVSPDHTGRPVCHLLWCSAGEGARANPGARGGAESGQVEAGVGGRGAGRLGSAIPGPRPGQAR
ncbi:PREDICTED: protein-cysteine N-palmitoyltransferase HHAT-like protein isoform X2 [Myotis brandtii]|uniref:protein-cysteine N-palmitoyltransferase HHAT-like protein isoform X2 n=1 Tax=Myotis brandtii TaxID=109478 RepID=UPI000703DF6E|nr:PREDICTED: protein-cysteine N-palmitoyltransferase HHAT-like protein isoform X2 [Myotis brandtii]